MLISVIVPTHNPDPGRFRRALAALRAQTMPLAGWELLVVDNATPEPGALRAVDLAWHPHTALVREDELGLTAARRRGFGEARGEVLVLVDDDNVLAPDYLTQVERCFASSPDLGAVGGRSQPEFEAPPPPWTREFDGLLALRDLGGDRLRAAWPAKGPRAYPACAPIGAGLALRREGAAAYVAALERDGRRRALDRAGTRLVSGGDNDLVMTILEAGFEVAYDPGLSLVHLIPAHRSTREYLGPLNRAVARSWVRVLALHGIRPWAAVARTSVAVRCGRSWWRTRAWRGPAEWVRWQGQCGQFEGRADLGEMGQAPS